MRAWVSTRRIDTWNPFWFLLVALASVWPFILAAVMFVRWDSLRLLVVLGLPAMFTWAGLFTVNQIMGHMGRFFFPSLPLVVLAGALLIERWVQDLSGRQMGPEISETLARGVLLRTGLALLLLWGGARLLGAAGRLYQSRAQTQTVARLDGYCVPAATPLPELDSWRSSQEIARFAAESPAGTRFAMSEHGLVGALAPEAEIIDVLGLHDPIFARNTFTSPLLWRRLPDVIWMPHPDHTRMVRDILDSDDFWQGYDFYPDAFSYGVALRKDSPHFSLLQALFAARWQAAYPGFRLTDHLAQRDTLNSCTERRYR